MRSPLDNRCPAVTVQEVPLGVIVTPITGGVFVTDLIAAPGAETASTEVIADTVPADTVPPVDRPVEWAPHEPAPKKRRLGLWIGLGVGVLVIGAAAASTILIAPGTTIAGVPVGGLTPGAAADVLASRVADTTVTLTDVDGEVVLSGADLGATIDARALADAAFASFPMWNLGSWMPAPIEADITLDPDVAANALRDAVPDSYLDAVDATVAFDEATGIYLASPAVPGTGIDLDALTAAITTAVAEGETAINFSGAPTEAAAAVDDQAAETITAELNTMLASIGFYVGEERTVPIAPAVAASWLSIVDEDGELHIDVDRSAIQATVDTLPGLVNVAPVNATTITNSAGTALSDLTAGVAGRALGDVSSTASDFAEQLATGNGIYQLPVEEVPFAVTNVVRKIDVNLSTQTISLTENGAVIDSWRVSSGVSGYETKPGNFTINWKLTSQNMGNQDTTKAPGYYQPNVKWVMYFNGDQALHGVYWHSAWGSTRSHGCVGMPEWRAQQVFNWAPEGVEISVHY